MNYLAFLHVTFPICEKETVTSLQSHWAISRQGMYGASSVGAHSVVLVIIRMLIRISSKGQLGLTNPATRWCDPQLGQMDQNLPGEH